MTYLRDVAEGEMPGRMPPHNLEAEQALLGALMVKNVLFDDLAEFLRPEHFADPVHGRIFAACGTLIGGGGRADPITLKTLFERDGGLAEIGGTVYLARLVNSVATIVNAADYGRLVFDLHLRRELIALGETLAAEAYDPGLDAGAGELAERAEAQLATLLNDAVPGDASLTMGEAALAAARAAEAAYKAPGRLVGVTTGSRRLDRLTGGLRPGNLVILAGRPSQGKTALAENIAEAAERAGARVGFFSMEMGAEELATRAISRTVQLPSQVIQSGQLDAHDMERVILAAQSLRERRIDIDPTPALTVPALRARARRLRRKGGLDLVVVDYLQLMRGTSRQGEANRVQEITEISRGLKALAKELAVPVLALSQLSRKVEEREDKRPQLSDLRESGSIEQDADVVMFVYREQYYLERAEPGRRPSESEEKYRDRHDAWQRRLEEVHNLAEVIVGKQRMGGIGTVRLFFDARYTKFGDLAEADERGME